MAGLADSRLPALRFQSFRSGPGPIPAVMDVGGQAARLGDRPSAAAMTDAPDTSDPDDRILERARNFRDAFGGSSLDQYRGIPIFAAPGLHELAARQLAAARPPDAGVRVLELGAGGGAMSQRLHDLGYAVTASDLFAERFQPHDRIAFHALDLNRDFAVTLPRRFDALVALELVEHLENSHHFLRQCFAALEPGGWAVLSTPNLANPVSQAMFASEGEFQWFRDEDYREQGHISPIAPFVLRRCWTEAGFALQWEGSVSDPFRRVKWRRQPRLWWLARLLALHARTPDALRGEVYVVVLHKPGTGGGR